MPGTEDLYRSYLDLRWHFDPAAASATGITSLDHRLGSFDAEAMRTHLSAFKSMATAVEQLEIDETEEEIDRTAFLDEIRITVLRFEREKPHIHDPGYWLSHLFQGFHSLLRRRDPEARPRGHGVLGRLKATPAFLRSARETLVDPPRIFLDTASAMVAGGPALFREAVGAAKLWAPRPATTWTRRWERPSPRSSDLHWRCAVSSTRNPDDLSFAIGEEQFNRRLHHEHALQAGAPELYRYGLHLVEEVEAEVMALAKKIDPSTPWRKLIERLRSQSPPDSDLVNVFREETGRARQFVAERSLVRIPTGISRWWTPLVSCDPWFPSPPTRRRERWRPTAADVLRHLSQWGSFLEGLYCMHEVAATAIHEAYPGHHLQMLTAQAQESPVRRVLWTPCHRRGLGALLRGADGGGGIFRLARAAALPAASPPVACDPHRAVMWGCYTRG
jgi:hypothetical protein